MARQTVKIITYSTALNNGPDEIEAALSEIHSNPESYDIISYDSSITPSGAFVCALVYKQLPDEPDYGLDLDDTVTVDENGSIISESIMAKPVKRVSKQKGKKQSSKKE